MSEPGAGAIPGGNADPARWWDDLLEDVASLVNEVSEVDVTPPTATGWDRNRERLASLLSQSDPSLASAALRRAAPSQPDPRWIRPPGTLPPPPPTQVMRGAPPRREPESALAENLPIVPTGVRQWNAATRTDAADAQVIPTDVPRGTSPAPPAPSPALSPTPSPAPSPVPSPALSPEDTGVHPPAPFVPARPGTIIEVPDHVEPAVAPWESNPGYVAPAQQTVATEMPTIGIPIAPGFIEAMTNRGYRPQGVRLNARVRVIWERLVTRQQAETLVVATLIVGMLLGALAIVILVFVVGYVFG